MADAVLPHVVATHAPGVDVLFLDTGYHFAETIGTRDAGRPASSTSPSSTCCPKLTVAEQDAEYGARLYERDPGAVLPDAQGRAAQRGAAAATRRG